MENKQSLDPRVNRFSTKSDQTVDPTTDNHGITWEVFHQEKR